MKKPNYPTVTATVIDEDTLRIGGSAFKRERTCRMTDNGDYTMLCSCGEEIEWHLTEHYGDGTAEYSYNYCPHCGARVERDV